jgi:hypothetical protein
MKRLILAIFAAVCASAYADSGYWKQGLWEVKMVHNVVDGKDMSAQMAAAQAKMQQQMANMPPAQRAQIEAMMSGSGSYRVCVSAAMAARDSPMVDREGKCEPAKVSHSGDKTTFEFNCTTERGTRVGKGESVRSGDTITTRMDMSSTDAKGTHTMQAETQMTFLGADCQGVKPADQMGK